MKKRITKKEVRNTHKLVLRVPYCGLQHLFTFREPYAYSARAEGWGCDYYSLGVVCVSTGYDPIGRDVPHEVVHDFDDRARDILRNVSDPDEARHELDCLIDELLYKVDSIFHYSGR